MQQGLNAGFSPAGCDLVKVLFEIAEDDVTVTVNQSRSGHWILKRAFRTHSAGTGHGPVPEAT